MRFVTTAVLVAMLGTVSAAHAETVTLKAEMNGSNEVPPNASTATGRAEARLDTVSKRLTYTITYSGLSGPAVGAHFHGPGEAGKNAGIVLPFKTLPSPDRRRSDPNRHSGRRSPERQVVCERPHRGQSGRELRGQMMK